MNKTPINGNPNNISCSIHFRSVEGFCKECQCYLCSSCMFSSPNPHKAHTLLSLIELSDYLRLLIDGNVEWLAHDYVDRHLLEFKQAKKNLEASSTTLIEKITKETDDWINVIKERRDNIISAIKDNWDREANEITKHEENWKMKMKIGQAINKIQTDYNDEVVYNNMELVWKGIEKLKEEVKVYEYKSIIDYKYCLELKKKVKKANDPNDSLNITDWMEMIETMYAFGDDDVIGIPYKA